MHIVNINKKMNKKNVKTPFNIVNRIIKQSYNEQQQATRRRRGDSNWDPSKQASDGQQR